MNVLELIARTTAHGVTYGQVARATLIASHAQEVEWMLVGLPRFQEQLIRAKWQQDPYSKVKAFRHLTHNLKGRGWHQGVTPGRVESLAAATMEHWSGWRTDKKRPSPNRCKWCSGNGGFLLNEKYIPCEPCKETGRTQIKPYQLMQMLGFKGRAIHEMWVTRQVDAEAYLDNQEGEAYYHMGKRLKD